MSSFSTKPSVHEVEALLRENPHANLVPVYTEFNADLETPVSAYLKVARSSQSFLFESVEGGERIARYSFIGTEPYKTLKQDGNGDPLIKIQEELAQYKPVSIQGIPKFTGGGVGYIGYECVKYFEPTVSFDNQKNALGLPESIFMFCDSLLIFDHVKHTILVVAHVRLDPIAGARPSSEELRALYRTVTTRIEVLLTRLNSPLPPPPIRTKIVPNELHSELNVGKDGYCNFVSSLKKDIVEGEIIQAVPSQRIKRRLNNVGAFDVYRQLRVVNPSPYLFFLDLEDFQIVGSSPEVLVKVEDSKIINHPIAGTRKRGRTDEEDKALEKELLESEKERAEHIMLVDLARNDVGRVSKPGTVEIEKFMVVERYSHVMHIVSVVNGTLRDDLTPYDAFRSVFPAGTVSGAPKIRAMQLVSDLETENRNIYAGAVGYIGFAGEMDTCIAIRTLVIRDNNAYLQAGGGIVFDSEPEEERQETINKMAALARAIDKAEEHALQEAHSAFSDESKDEHSDRISVPKHFGIFGGSYVPETLVEPLRELTYHYSKAMKDPMFLHELQELNKHYVGRPTPLYYAKRLTEHCGGARIWLKREDLAHTGAHKINNALGSCLLAKRMGKTRVIAETGAGQHGVATATACALMNLECHVFMGEEDIKRQALNVFRMKMLGAEVVPVTCGARTLKDAVSEALRNWITYITTTFYCVGSVVGPHPYPAMVRDFQSIIGRESRSQMLERAGKLPDVVVACVGGGSNSIGIFHPFIKDPSVRLVGIEAAGLGLNTDKHSASITGGSPGVLHGMRTYVLQDENGQISEAHSVSAGLDYPGVGPEHAHLAHTKRAEYYPVTDDEALQALQDMTRLEGIIPALETSHAIHWAMLEAKKMSKDQDMVINISGRGDKDMPQVSRLLGPEYGLGVSLD